jgi:hypothetical protein
VFVEERSVRVLAVRLQVVGVTVTCQTLRENVRTDELVTSNTTPHHTSDTTPHVYGNEMLVIAFDSSMWIITIP